MKFECYRCGADFPELVPFCPHCLIDGAVQPAIAGRPHARIHDEPHLTNARELARNRWTLVDVPACPGLKLIKGAFALIYGPPGAGKSTLALQVLDSIQGPVLAYLPEERTPSPTVDMRLERLRIRRPDFHLLDRTSIDHLANAVRTVRAKALLIDSLTVTPLQPDQARELVQRLGLLAIFGILQVNKKGEIAGLKAWEHEADIAIRVDQARWTVEKSRFQPQPYPSGPIAMRASPNNQDETTTP